MKHKQIVKNNKIVYANWFLRQGEAVWDFIYSHVLPIRMWYWFGDQKKKVIYGFERMFTGFDRRISWGYESSIDFYKRLLSDLIKNAHGHPTNLWDICQEEWNSFMEQEYAFLLKDHPECKSVKEIAEKEMSGKLDLEKSGLRDAFYDDMFKCWKKYLKRVLHYFNEADPETSSTRIEQEELYAQMKNPFEEKERTVVEHNGMLFYQYPSLGDSEEDQKQRKILEELNSIDEYKIEMLKKGMAEVAKNIVYLND